MPPKWMSPQMDSPQPLWVLPSPIPQTRPLQGPSRHRRLRMLLNPFFSKQQLPCFGIDLTILLRRHRHRLLIQSRPSMTILLYLHLHHPFRRLLMQCPLPRTRILIEFGHGHRRCKPPPALTKPLISGNARDLTVLNSTNKCHFSHATTTTRYCGREETKARAALRRPWQLAEPRSSSCS